MNRFTRCEHKTCFFSYYIHYISINTPTIKDTGHLDIATICEWLKIMTYNMIIYMKYDDYVCPIKFYRCMFLHIQRMVMLVYVKSSCNLIFAGPPPEILCRGARRGHWGGAIQNPGGLWSPGSPFHIFCCFAGCVVVLFPIHGAASSQRQWKHE